MTQQPATLPSDFFVQNRHRLYAGMESLDLIILTAHGQLQRSSDNVFSFQQDSSFWYLTGVEYADIIFARDGQGEFLIVPSRGAVREAFDGSIDARQLTAVSGIAEILDEEHGWKRLEASLKQTKRYATLAPPPPYFDTFGVYANPARATLAAKIAGIQDGLEVQDIRQDVARLRMIKQPAELALLQGAIDITIDTLLDVAQPEKLQSYTHEYQLDADITRGFRYRGAKGHGFDPIVAGGHNATTLHNVANASALGSGDLVVLDVGAEYGHYCADITRTYSLSGQPSGRQQAVHQAVLDVQEYAYGLLNPGIQLKQYEQDIERFMGEQLIGLGLITKNEHEEVRKYYPHSTSHFLGIDPHDAGDYQAPLAAGTVITVEPGIYIPEEGIGVRIEDDVLITADGIKVLTDRLPKALSL